MTEGEDRTIAEDLACPVEIQPGFDQATPDGWSWKLIGTSQPNQATFHMSHSDVGRVIVDVLRPSDSPHDAQFVVAKDIPIIVMDSIDKYWAGESRIQLPLHGVRVPVEGETKDEAKSALAADLAAQLRLLLLLAASHRNLAPELRENLNYLKGIMGPGPGLEKRQE
ncbi:MAG: hypothetical protein IH962_01615 [Chloroflexi bacterium]|nr:hypothetical protein [Chloroflexota bacterium]